MRSIKNVSLKQSLDEIVFLLFLISSSFLFINKMISFVFYLLCIFFILMEHIFIKEKSLSSFIKNSVSDYMINILLIIWICISCLATFSYYEGVYRNFAYAALYSLPLFTPHLYELIRQKQQRLPLLIHSFFGSVCLSTIVKLFYLIKEAYNGNDISRLDGFLGNANVYSYAFSLVLIILTVLIIHSSRVKHIISLKWTIFYFIVSLIGVYFSYSRGAALLFIVPFIFLVFKSQNKKLKLIVSFNLIFILILLFIIQPSRITNPGKLVSVSDKNFLFRENDRRISMYKTAFHTFIKYPIFGIGGPDKFKRSIDDLKTEFNISHENSHHAHNNLLQFLAAYGILGGLFLIIFHVKWFLHLQKNSGFFFDISLGILIGYLIGGLFEVTIQQPPSVMIAFFVYGLTVYFDKNSEVASVFSKTREQ